MLHLVFCTGKMPVLHFKPLFFMKKTFLFLLLVMGMYQNAQAQTTAYLGEIRMFAGNYAPQGWAFCDGKLLTVTQHTALYSLLGNRYGGEPEKTFALPLLCGRTPTGSTPDEVGKSEGNKSMTLQRAPSETIAQTTPTPFVGVRYIICISGAFPSRN